MFFLIPGFAHAVLAAWNEWSSLPALPLGFSLGHLGPGPGGGFGEVMVV